MESIKDGRAGGQDASSQKHVLPALWMDSSPWNGHSLRAPTRAMDPPRIIFMDSTKPWGGEKRCHEGGPTNSSSHRCKLFTNTQRVFLFCSPAFSNKPSVQS